MYVLKHSFCFFIYHIVKIMKYLTKYIYLLIKNKFQHIYSFNLKTSRNNNEKKEKFKRHFTLYKK